MFADGWQPCCSDLCVYGNNTFPEVRQMQITSFQQLSLDYNVNTWLDAHLHIRLNMPVLSKFDVRPAVPAWFTNADRRSRQSAGKTTVQPWFSDVFDLERRDA